MDPKGTIRRLPVGPTVGERAETEYKSALQRYLDQMETMRTGFAEAEAPLIEARGMFAPGGGYGAGQMALIESEAKKSRAGSMWDLIKSGMSSGTAAGGVSTAIGKNVATAKLGVEDERTRNLMNVLSQLSGLRGQAAGTMGTYADPYYAPYMGILGTEIGAEASKFSAGMGAAGQVQAAKIKARAPQQTTGGLQRVSPWPSNDIPTITR